MTAFGSAFGRTLGAALVAGGWDDQNTPCYWLHAGTGCEVRLSGRAALLRREGRTIMVAHSGRADDVAAALHCVEQITARVRQIESARQVAAPAD